MTTIQTSMPGAGKVIPRSSAWDRLRINRNWLALWFMLPAAAFLLLFLAYPLFLGVWMSFTDDRIGRGGVFVGLRELRVAEGRQHLLALGVQYAALYDRRLGHQIRRRPLSGAAARTATCRSRR